MNHWQKLGAHFGYPACCVAHFSALCEQGRMPGREAALADPQGPWNGTGFVPCPSHVEALRGKTRASVAALLVNRQHSRPFPHSDDDEVERFIVGTSLATAD